MARAKLLIPLSLPILQENPLSKSIANTLIYIGIIFWGRGLRYGESESCTENIQSQRAKALETYATQNSPKSASPRRYWAVTRPTANKKGQRRTVDLYILVVGMDAGSNPIISVGVG
jgi:hypothetical protein